MLVAVLPSTLPERPLSLVQVGVVGLVELSTQTGTCFAASEE